MKLLEQKASHTAAARAQMDVAPQQGILFVRYESRAVFLYRRSADRFRSASTPVGPLNIFPNYTSNRKWVF